MNLNKTVRFMLIALFAGIFLYAAWQVIGILRTYGESKNAYDALEQYVSFDTSDAAHADTPQGSLSQTELSQTKPSQVAPLQTKPSQTDLSQPEASQTEPSQPDTPGKASASAWPEVDFDALSKVNPDIVGWIHIEGTGISYPVVQGEDNERYLTRMFDGTEHKSGCIFLDCRSAPDFTDWHSILYGHHMKDGSMFGGLMKYKKDGFYKAHPEAVLVTPQAHYRICFFSGYVSDENSSAWQLEANGSERTEWIEEVKAKSCFNSDCIPQNEDRIVTLSTCTYEFDDARFVLHGYISGVVRTAKADAEN